MLQLLLGAITLALALATLRVVIMANLIAQPQAFDYWHGAAGSQIFSTTGIILFALLCQQFSSVQQAQQLQQFQQHSKG